ncbi:MAG: Rieske 2Fe-2S domain-containing protein [Alphaproteobacteria bacterium]|nr:Rieske 2Fe-2S domain-containing protein [Alphaproteobacteria bacterium]
MNDGKSFQVAGRNILVCRTKEGFFAVDNLCTHQLQELEGGKIRGCYIFCPLHGQRFDLRDGKPIGQLTDKPLPTYPIELEGRDVRVSPRPNVGERD